MSSNPPDPNDLLKFLIQQQQQQAQQGGQRNQGSAQAADASLGNLIAEFLKASSGSSASGAGSTSASSAAAFASLLPPTNNGTTHAGHNPPAAAAGTAAQQQQQQLLASAKLLASVNPSLAASAVEHAMALASQPASQNQQQQGYLQPPQQQQLQFSLNPQGQHPLSSLSTDATKKSPSSSINSSGHGSGNGTSNPSQPSITASQRTSGSSQGNSTNINSNGKKGSVTLRLPPEPVSLLTLQTWNLEQLEAHAKLLKECNRPIPNAVNILLDDARRREQKRHAKRISNRKSASTSRARKKQLIDELTAANAKLRRQALILSYLPDPVVAIGVDGKIKFCSVQVERVLRHKLSDLVDASIEDILVPESRGAIRRLIQDLVTAEEQAANAINRGEAGNGSGNEENGGQNSNESGDSSNDANVISRSSDQSFPMLEVNVDGQDEVAAGENVSDSSGDPPSKNEGKKSSKHKNSNGKSNSRSTVSSLTQKSSSLTTEASTTEDNEEPPAKKSKTTATERKTNSPESGSSEERKPSGAVKMNVDDVMGASVTANNAGAKLSSLMHYPKEEPKEEPDNRKPPPEELQQEPHIHRKHVLAPRTASALAQKEDSQSSSSTESAPRPRAGGINSSEDSGYRDSNESSDEYAEDSSSISGTSLTSRKKGKRPRPLAPGCNVRLIRNDLTTIWCELTSSIRTRTFNDEDSELGIIDHNPKPAAEVLAEEPTTEKELLLCFRPILEGERVGEELRFPRQISESSNATESEELTFNKSSSGNEDKGSSDLGADAPSSETQTGFARGSVEGRQPLKKRTFESGEADSSSSSSSKEVCVGEKESNPKSQG